MGEPAVTYSPRPDTTSEGELDTLATIYRFVLDCSERKKAAHPGRPEDAKEIKHVRAETIIPK